MCINSVNVSPSVFVSFVSLKNKATLWVAFTTNVRVANSGGRIDIQ